MKPYALIFRTFLVGGLASFSVIGQSSQVEEAQQRLSKWYVNSAKVQSRIDALDEQTRQDYYEYIHTVKRAEQIETYNAQLQKLISSQEDELNQLEQQLVSLSDTEQAALPLLNKMLKTLNSFDQKDLPFLTTERSERLTRLSALLDRADVSVAEKYRQVLEAYQIEVEYGRTLEAYSGMLTVIEQPSRDVTFLRLGRVALYYQTSDGQESGQWNPETQSWQQLAESMNLSLIHI